MTARNVKDILELKGEGEHLRLIVPRGLKGRGARAQAGAFLEKAARRRDQGGGLGQG